MFMKFLLAIPLQKCTEHDYRDMAATSSHTFPAHLSRHRSPNTKFALHWTKVWLLMPNVNRLSEDQFILTAVLIKWSCNFKPPVLQCNDICCDHNKSKLLIVYFQDNTFALVLSDLESHFSFLFFYLLVSFSFSLSLRHTCVSKKNINFN